MRLLKNPRVVNVISTTYALNVTVESGMTFNQCYFSLSAYFNTYNYSLEPYDTLALVILALVQKMLQLFPSSLQPYDALALVILV